MVDQFPADYLLNRIGGGDVSGLRGMFIEQEVKRRNLTAEGTAEAAVPQAERPAAVTVD